METSPDLLRGMLQGEYTDDGCRGNLRRALLVGVAFLAEESGVSVYVYGGC